MQSPPALLGLRAVATLGIALGGDMGFSALPVRLTLLVTFAMLLSMRPAAADDADTCTHGSGDDRIAACTRAINSGRWTGSGLAWAYLNRGKAYRDKADYDRAIQDYDQT